MDGAVRRSWPIPLCLATGSRPRSIPEIPIDHEHVLDSDSILSMIYLPESLTVLGGGVIACEYAATFALLGSRGHGHRPGSNGRCLLGQGSRGRVSAEPRTPRRTVLSGHTVKEVAWDGVSAVVARLENGMAVKSEKMLVALGRQPNVEDLNLEAAGLSLDSKGYLSVNGSGKPWCRIFMQPATCWAGLRPWRRRRWKKVVVP